MIKIQWRDRQYLLLNALIFLNRFFWVPDQTYQIQILYKKIVKSTEQKIAAIPIEAKRAKSAMQVIRGGVSHAVNPSKISVLCFLQSFYTRFCFGKSSQEI